MEKRTKMKTKQQTNRRKNYIYNSKHNLFSSARQQIECDSKGCHAIIINICNSQHIHVNAFNKKIYNNYPLVLANREAAGRISLGKCQTILVDKNKEYGHKLYVTNLYACAGKKTSNNRTVNYYALALSLHHLANFIRSEIHNSENSEFRVFIDKKSLAFTGCNWSFVDNLLDDIMPDIEVEIYDQ